MSGPFLPPVNHVETQPWRTPLQEQEREQLLASEYEAIFNYYANQTEAAEQARTFVPELGSNTCFDTRIFDICCRMILNPWRMAKDTVCGCFIPCTMPQPDHPTFLPENVYNRLRSADIYLNRNTCLLCCVTPFALAALPYVSTLPLSARTIFWLSPTSGCMANNCALANAGCLTYLWSGDFGGQEQKASDFMLFLMRGLSYHLQSEWAKVRSTPHSENFLARCRKVQSNGLNIKVGMINAGLTPDHVLAITNILFETLKTILAEDCQVNTPPPVLTCDG